jgi:Fe-S-cluster-containing dehydrogenase component
MASTMAGVAWRDPTKCRHCETDLASDRQAGTVYCSDACETAATVTGKLEGPQNQTWKMFSTSFVASSVSWTVSSVATWSST